MNQTLALSFNPSERNWEARPRIMKSGVLVAFVVGSVLAGCDLPRDPEETLEAVQGRELRVGVLKFGENAEKDRPIVERLAASLGSKLVYVEGDAHALFEDLKRGHIHVVIGGVPVSTPFEKELGLSKPVGALHGAHEEEDRVIAVRPGENAFLLRVNQAIEEARATGAGS
jgi:hypothetical protein